MLAVPALETVNIQTYYYRKAKLPSWWPADIPFQHPKDPVPENFKSMPKWNNAPIC